MVRLKSFDLDDRVVLVTGGAGRLGTAMSLAILAAGAQLVMCGRREQVLKGLRANLPESQRRRCHIVPADITREQDVDDLCRNIEERFGALHGVVNNAYTGRVGSLETIEAADFHMANQYNLIAPFLLVKKLRPLLERSARRSAVSVSVVNVASMYGVVSPDPSLYGDTGRNNPVHYGATKAGLIQLTRYLACHLGASGIRVNSVAPGPFPDTGEDPEIPCFYENLAARVPLRRLGTPEEITGPVVFLLSEAASYVNGVNLAVDGGWTAW